ncbi:hypothetical protein AB0O91_36805 [Kitasatospora sp. NPDC089797]|uniref:hypothetical protein n=1 Tax=Kitasatospora sp. NPDC089797 TaxID=3155298 RepID=UPI003447F383
MGRFKEKKPRRSRFQIDDRPVDEVEMMAHAVELSNTVDDHGLLLFMDDPALGFGKVATGVAPDGMVETSDEEEPFPVALFEPARSMMSQLPGQVPREVQVEGAIAAGLRRLPRGIADLRTVPGWQLHRLGDERLELRSPDGGVYSRIAVSPDPAWISSALHHGFALCLYGPKLGVRVPPARRPDQYTAADRLTEIRTARGEGLVAAGFVAFHNDR